MKSLVTGANGFIGSAVVRCLLAKNYQVTALIRKGSDFSNLENLPVELAYGDLTDKISLRRAMQDCQNLFHVGAFYRLWNRDASEFYSVNVDGTRNIMTAALDEGVEKIVYTSSIATLGTASAEAVANEETRIDHAFKKGHYKRSKFLAEKEVTRLVEEESLPAVIVNPTAPIGPGDIKPTPTGRLIRDAALGRIPAFVNTGLNIVHVDDVAEGHFQALLKGEVGEKYILGGENMSLKEILETVSNFIQRSPPKVQLPPDLILPVAYLAEAWAHITHGNEPLITVAGVRLSKQLMYFTSDKAREKLGYRSRPALKAIEDAVLWFQRETENNENNFLETAANWKSFSK